MRFCTLVGILLALAASAGAEPVRMRGPGLPPGVAAEPSVLTLAQLEQCLDQEATANRLGEDVRSHQNGLNAELEAVRRSEADLHRRNLVLRNDDRAEVEAYNIAIARHRVITEAFTGRLPAHNGRVGTYNAMVERFNGECADRPFWEADMEALRRRTQVAAPAR